jgi:hypothetical protein
VKFVGRVNEYELGIYECREQLAEWMSDHSYATGHGDSITDLLKELEWQIAEKINKNRGESKDAK